MPTFDNLTAFDLVVDRMQELGLWCVSFYFYFFFIKDMTNAGDRLMYDMRW